MESRVISVNLEDRNGKVSIKHFGYKTFEEAKEKLQDFYTKMEYGLPFCNEYGKFKVVGITINKQN